MTWSAHFYDDYGYNCDHEEKKKGEMKEGKKAANEAGR
jgi:hypothetical protein